MDKDLSNYSVVIFLKLQQFLVLQFFYRNRGGNKYAC